MSPAVNLMCFKEMKALLSPVYSLTYCFMVAEYSENDNSEAVV